MSSSSRAKASFRLPWGREEVIVAVEAIVGGLCGDDDDVVVVVVVVEIWSGLA